MNFYDVVMMHLFQPLRVINKMIYDVTFEQIKVTKAPKQSPSHEISSVIVVNQGIVMNKMSQ